MLTKPKCWGHLCTPEALSLVNQMGTDWHDLAHLTRFEDLEHIVPQFFKIKFADYRFRPNVLVKNADSEVCAMSCCKSCEGHCCLSINLANAP